jgi:long-subunit acyl-CoA synthetase (AMP-forming)
VRQYYSNVASLKGDLAEVKPDCLVTVPLVLATLHGRVMAGLAAAPAARKAIAEFLLSAGQAHVRAMRVAPARCSSPRHRMTFSLSVARLQMSTSTRHRWSSRFLLS